MARQSEEARRCPPQRRCQLSVFSIAWSSPWPAHRTSGGCAGHGEVQRTERQAGAATSPTPRKMSKAEKQQAKERARRWHENRRRGGGARHRESSDEEDTDSLTSSPDTSPRFDDNLRPPAVARASTAGAGDSIRREEVVNLLSPPSHQSTPWLSGRQARPSNAARSSSAAEIEQSLRRDTQQSRSFSMRATVTSAAGRTRETQREETQQWACPRCTLLNPHRQLVCEACHHVNVPRQKNYRRDANSGGGLVYDVDRNGNFIEEGDRNGQGRAQRPPAAAATMASRVGYEGSGVGGHVARSRSVLDNDGWGRPRGLYSSNRSFLASLNGPQMEASAMLHQYIHSTGHRNASLYPPGSRGGVDNMSYERLLEMFGDGSENRGASSEEISSLPVSKVGDPERDLPEDKRQCSICLDEFSRGDERTSLPCLHSFHSQCVNRWLSSNGTCPVCKTSVRENGRG
ncbi:hypothetical protein ACHAWF_007063 [Thalassiosira exigua]